MTRRKNKNKPNTADGEEDQKNEEIQNIEIDEGSQNTRRKTRKDRN